MPTLGSVHASVSRWLRRGNVFDADIPDLVRMAARSIERNYTLKYMERYVSFVISSLGTEPRAINLPSKRIKKIQSIRLPLENGKFFSLRLIDPRELHSNRTGMPEGYWLDGMDYIWFDNLPDKDYPAEMVYDEYTAWPTALDATNWLIENADDLLVAHTLTHFKVLARLPPDARQEINEMVVRAMNELVRADEELRGANLSVVMNYGVVQ